ncbi:MAG: hypothetical protein PHD68_02210 [Rugosibacter sp.]|nr:hypothetical protein [Rugosibacter sp.]
MMQTKVDLISSVDAYGRTLTLQEHGEGLHTPAWLVELTEAEFMELTHVMYEEYRRIKMRDREDRNLNVPAEREKDKFYIEWGVFADLSCLSRLDASKVEIRARSLERLLAFRGSADDLRVAIDIANDHSCYPIARTLQDYLLGNQKKEVQP